MQLEELIQTLKIMQQDTRDGKQNWSLTVQTTEGNEEKYTVEEENRTWTIDECYVSYHCTYRGKEFCMITYEMIKTSGDLVQTVKYVFLPPRGVRLFSLHTLLEYSVEANQRLITQVHNLWEILMGLVKKESSQVKFHIEEASVHVE